MTPKESLVWESIRQRDEAWEQAESRESAGVAVGMVFKIAVFLLAMVVFVLADQWVRW